MNIPIDKNAEQELPIPTTWRKTLIAIVDAIINENLNQHNISYVKPVSREDVTYIQSNIIDYGEELIPLPKSTWDTSIYVWMNGFWEILLDLFTVEEGRSDLVLLLRVYEHTTNYQFEVMSVHVP